MGSLSTISSSLGSILCDDVKHKLHHISHYQADQEIPEDDVYNYGLWDLNRILVRIGRSLADFLPIPFPQQQLLGNYSEAITLKLVDSPGS